MWIIQRPIRAALCILCLGLISACALLKKPIPLTQIQLALDNQQISWPSGISLGSIQSRAVLRTDRVIVTRGALVMQHEGLRWTSAPEVQLVEQIGMPGMLTHRVDLSLVQGPSKLARIDVWLNEFNVAVMPDGTSLAIVSAAATLKCTTVQTTGSIAEPAIEKLPLMRATLPLNSTDPQRVSKRFSEAATIAFSQLLTSAALICRTR